MSGPIVVYDACVLFSAQLRDLMMHPALAGLCSARWTDEILDEWTRSILAKHAGVSPESVARCRTFMNSHIGDALVVGYEYRTPTLTLPDPDDRHVLTAAIHGRATAIVTFNLKDFPDEILSKYGIEAIHPDEFVAGLLMSRPTEVVEAIRTQRLQLTRPPVDVEAFLTRLERQGLPRTVTLLSQFADQL